MHYRQTIIDAATTALTNLDGLGVTSTNFYSAAISPTARVWWTEEALPVELQTTTGGSESRVMTLRVQLAIASDDVQRDANDLLADMETQLDSGLDPVSDCAYLLQAGQDISTDADNEGLNVIMDYVVQYATAVGDPTTRV